MEDRRAGEIASKRMLIFIAVGLGLILSVVGSFWVDRPTTIHLPLSGHVIAIDAGHGGPDGGAVSKSGIVEKDITLKVALILRDYLQESGALVVMTRETDRDLAEEGTKGYSKRKTQDLMQRVHLIKEKQADTLVSIHLNAIPSPKWSGAQTFYHPSLEESRALATSIQEEIIRNLKNTTRLPKQREDIYILKASGIPAAMVEIGFLSNPEEAALLADEKYQRKMAEAIYRGVLKYRSKEPIPKLEE